MAWQTYTGRHIVVKKRIRRLQVYYTAPSRCSQTALPAVRLHFDTISCWRHLIDACAAAAVTSQEDEWVMMLPGWQHLPPCATQGTRRYYNHICIFSKIPWLMRFQARGIPVASRTDLIDQSHISQKAQT